MGKNGKMQKVVMGTLMVILVASLLLAMTSVAVFAKPPTPLADDPHMTNWAIASSTELPKGREALCLCNL